ncbi:hypothetical protein CXB51_002643 [Gossypium anomalum]|uniref:NAB domain-containing protein n=1 Tax=Gossypium anomalum TaxID=47600 RepID=A0A8J5ZHU3_9ROSI|nr:hypothetical protein CXB51_002643 [Gossypium anomalum]
MDKEEQQHQTAVLSRVDSQVLRQQSQWLQTILSELDMKINAILSIIVQDAGDTFAKRAEMYYQKRPELIEMVEDLQKSYRSLAEKYDQLRSQLNNQGLQNHVEGEEHEEASAEDPEHEIEFHRDPSKGPADPTKTSKNVNGVTFQRNISDGSQLMENEKLWSELRFKVSELVVEDNLSQQAELIRRNDEKRGKIRELLGTKMNVVDDDNEKTTLPSHKVPKKTKSLLSRLKRLFLGRFT